VTASLIQRITHLVDFIKGQHGKLVPDSWKKSIQMQQFLVDLSYKTGNGVGESKESIKSVLH